MKIKEIKLKGPSEKAKKFIRNFINEYNKGLKAIKAINKIKKIIGNKNKFGYAFCDTRLFEIEEIINEVEDAN